MEDLLKLIVPHAILLAVIGFLCRSIISHWLSKDVDRFKERLHAEHEAEAAKMSHTLELAQLEHEIRFSRVYEKRFLKIEELHTDSRHLVDALAEALRVEAATRANRIVDAHASVLALQRELKLYEIFLPADFVAVWEEELSRIYSSLHDLASATSDPRNPRQPALRESVNEIAASLRALNGQLADRARRILENPTQPPPPSASVPVHGN